MVSCRSKLHELPHHQERGCTPAPATTAPPLPAYRLTLREPDRNTAAAPTTSVPAEIQQPAAVPGNITEQAQLQMPPAPVANPLQAPAGPVFGQVTVQELLHSPQEQFSSLKEEVGLFIIRQFLSKSQDGATILLKTGGQVNSNDDDDNNNNNHNNNNNNNNNNSIINHLSLSR